MDDILQWDDSHNSLHRPTDQLTQAQPTDGMQRQTILPPTMLGSMDPLATPVGPGQPPSVEYNQPPNPSQEFLQLDFNRLQNNNSRLRVEVEILRKRDREMQGQLNELRDSLQPMEHLLQELLYAPDVQNGNLGVSNRLFAIFDMVEAMNKALSPGTYKQ